jgi:hypothetical protein
MLVLFDQGTPLPIREFLKQHRAETAVLSLKLQWLNSAINSDWSLNLSRPSVE